MHLHNSIEEIKLQAHAALEQADALEMLIALELPGRFVFSAPTNHRLVVSTMEELHAARTILRENFGWRDRMRSKFFSCGVVIVTYAPEDGVVTPLPFELWVEAPPESFPEQLLGGCKLVKSESVDYSVVCPVAGEE